MIYDMIYDLLRTLTRNRRSLVGCSFHWVAQNVCQDHAGSAQRAPEIARDRPRVAPERRKSGPRAAQERSKSSQRAPMRPQERPKNAQECQKSAQEQPKRLDEDTFRDLLMDFEEFCNFLEASECPKRGQDIPKGLLEGSWGLLEGSCEALGSILMAFEQWFGAILELGERFRRDFPKY